MQQGNEETHQDGEPAADILHGDELGTLVRESFEEVKTERRLFEQKWIANLRQYKGIYPDDTERKLKAAKRSKAYIRVTRTKVKTMDSRANDMLFPGGEQRNWAISPTPKPEIPEWKKRELVEQVIQATDGQDKPNEQEIEIMVKELAKKAAERMGDTIHDQLVELRYSDIAREVLHSGHLYGTGILKGPMAESKTYHRWATGETEDHGRPGQDEIHKLESKQVKTPYAESVSIFDLYCDMSVSMVKDCDFFIQRHVMPRHKLRRLAKRKGFDDTKILDYIKARPGGDATYLEHETDLKDLNESLDAVSGSRKNKYEVLEYWGIIDGEMLAECGCDIPEEEQGRDYEAMVWVVGQTAIKAVLNPTAQQQRPFHFYYFEKDDTSIYGESVPDVMEDTDMLFNSAIRAALDNAAITAGPQIEVNMDLIHDTENIRDVFPFKVWVREGLGLDAQHPAVRVLNVENHVGELMSLADKFKELGDEASTIPSYVHGEASKGVGKTVGGLSMLMGAANITLKDTIKNYDMVSKSFISAMYHWNMQFSEDDSIKGDYDIQAIGSTSLVAKEVMSQTLDEFAKGTTNAIDDPWIKRGELNRQREKTMNLSGIVRTDSEYKEHMDEIAAMQAQAAAAAKGTGAPM